MIGAYSALGYCACWVRKDGLLGDVVYWLLVWKSKACIYSDKTTHLPQKLSSSQLHLTSAPSFPLHALHVLGHGGEGEAWQLGCQPLLSQWLRRPVMRVSMVNRTI